MPAPGEDAAAFASRLEGLDARLARMEEAFRKEGKYLHGGVELPGGRRIPAATFEAPCRRTKALYGFSCTWVPGFYVSPGLSLFYGGEAAYDYPEMFAYFLLRANFRKKAKWLWYDRETLLAHELCHVARLPLDSHDFEEHFAYQTSGGAFQRGWGGVFHSQWDSLSFLGSTLFLLIWQAVRAFLMPAWPAWPGWIPLAVVFIFLIFRHLRLKRQFGRALTALAARYGSDDKGRIALFHCTDAEIRQLAGTADAAALVGDWEKRDLRWQILRHRLTSPDSSANPPPTH